MKNSAHFPQLFLRLALGIGFILPVMDRFGWLGAPGNPTVGWGNWSIFLDYTNSLMPFLSRPFANIMAIIATAGELVFGVLLIIGYKIRLAAIGSFLLTLMFALSMLIFANYRAPFNYSVFVVSASSLLLATTPDYKWAIEANNR
ncbi:hypothetical protein D3C87_563780 [compost metagenome]|uniref:DoxX family protein n=1 Tax=Pedobacter ghigonis TaxID=2730403 RepID=UPI000FBB3183|nr:DoxX family protein [Pedobacter ghigonis]